MHIRLSLHAESVRALRRDIFQNTEACLVSHEFRQRNFRGTRVESERIFALGDQPWIVAEERPIACLHSELLLIQALIERIAVGDAVRIRDDQRGAVEGFGFAKRQHRLTVFGAEAKLSSKALDRIRLTDGDFVLFGWWRHPHFTTGFAHFLVNARTTWSSTHVPMVVLGTIYAILRKREIVRWGERFFKYFFILRS